MITHWILALFYKNRKTKVLNECGNVCHCPKCRDILNDQAEWIPFNDEGEGQYRCTKCNYKSTWHFGIAPVPIYIGAE